MPLLLPFLGAIAGCHWDATLARLSPFLGAIAGCHCWVPLGRNFGEVVVAAVPGCHCWARLVDHAFGEVGNLRPE